MIVRPERGHAGRMLLAAATVAALASCSSQGESVDSASAGATGAPVFLAAQGLGSEAQTNAYYARFVPNFEPGRYTLTEWKARAFASGLTVNAYYRNANELGFWRDMTCSQIVRRGAGGCSVTNYINETDR